MGCLQFLSILRQNKTEREEKRRENTQCAVVWFKFKTVHFPPKTDVPTLVGRVGTESMRGFQLSLAASERGLSESPCRHCRCRCPWCRWENTPPQMGKYDYWALHATQRLSFF